jgi:hypothetical protein
MLSIRETYNFSRYLERHFYTLFKLQSDSFLNYLSKCTFKLSLSIIYSWPDSYEETSMDETPSSMLSAYHTSYLDEDFLRNTLSITTKEIKYSNFKKEEN